MRMREWWDDLRQDMSFAARAMLKSPGFTAAVVLTLALGIGASSAMFTVVDAVLLRPFGFAAPERLAVLTEVTPEGELNKSIAPTNFLAWREQSRAFEALAAWADGDRTLTGGGEAELLPARFTTGNYFSVLGARPHLGRTYTEAEEEANVVVLSHRLWQSRFGGDPSIVDRTIILNDRPFTVIGIMPADLPSIGEKPDLWAPMRLAPEWQGRYLRAVGRLRPGATLEGARTEMTMIGQRLANAYPAFNKGWGVSVRALSEAVSGDVRPALLVLLGAVGFLLLIACANVANLLLARAVARRREVAVRRALGATRGRLIRQLLAESLFLASLAAALGILVAVLGTRLLVLRIPAALALPRFDEIGVNLRVVAFTAGASLLTGILFGLAPALSGSSTGPGEAMRDATRGTTSGRERGRLRGALVVAEVALALMLLAGAGLLARSFQNLVRVDSGMRTEQVLAVRVAARSARYQEPGALVGLTTELQQRLAALPEARAVGVIGPWLPFTGSKSSTGFRREDQPPPPVGEEPVTDIRITAGDYFRAVGIPLLHGRTFDARDTDVAPTVFVINEELARRHFPGEDPIGKRISFRWDDLVPGEIVGVVGSVRELGPAAEPAPAIYRPYTQMPNGSFHLVVRTAGEPQALAGTIREVVRSLDPNLPVPEIRTMDQVAGETVARPRLNLLLLGGFAALALVLAAIGLYGVMAYSVTQRRAEVGVRMALGASRPDVVRLVISQGIRLTLAGLLVGLAGSLVLTRLMASLLFGVQPTDPLTLAAVAVFLAAIALVASWIPARRAASTDPAIVLRAE
jgi:putative ABC transport system permease protein